MQTDSQSTFLYLQSQVTVHMHTYKPTFPQLASSCEYEYYRTSVLLTLFGHEP